jgi:hypothetical protein
MPMRHRKSGAILAVLRGVARAEAPLEAGSTEALFGRDNLVRGDDGLPRPG